MSLGRSILLSCLLVTGLASCGLSVQTTGFQRDTLLVLPPRDVVQGGQPHAAGVGSGERLRTAVANRLQTRGWEVLTTAAESFDHLSVPSQDDALNEGRRQKAAYVLTLVLGEFRDAAPMTFRSDFVTLDQASLLDCSSGNVVWFLEKPYVYESTNIGSHGLIVDNLGAMVAASLEKSVE